MSAPAAGAFRALYGFNYRVWAIGSLVSNIGTWIQQIAQDWLVLTQLTHHDASAVGTVMALQYGPQLLLLPWTGYSADRFDQRKLLMVTQTLMGATALVLGTLTVIGVVQLWHVYLFAFLFGCVSTFDGPVRQTFVAELVGDRELANAVALNSASFNAARMIGPAAAGLVIASVGPGWAFLANGLSFIAVLVSLIMLRTNDLRANTRANRSTGGMLNGVRYVSHRADLMAMFLMLFLIGTFGLNFQLFISTMAVSVFHVDARGFGMLSSMLAIGTISGALLAARREQPHFRHLWIGAALLGLSWTLAALALSFWLFGAALVLTGIAAITFMNSTNTLMQLSSEPEMRGRVMALRLAVASGGIPFGAPIVGWTANHLGPRWALVVGAASCFAAAAVGFVTLARRSAKIR
ncbi:MFS transporter [Burkholderia sp. Ed8]|uniref:MFS transporter n=1 Tax=Burkholderia sp. Ed8 TaxID=3112957 RepID=UPI00345D23F5